MLQIRTTVEELQKTSEQTKEVTEHLANLTSQVTVTTQTVSEVIDQVTSQTNRGEPQVKEMDPKERAPLKLAA